MSKGILLTSTAIIACTVAIYAGPDLDCERFTHSTGSLSRMHELVDKSSLQEQAAPTVQMSKNMGASVGLSDSIIIIQPEEALKKKASEDTGQPRVVEEQDLNVSKLLEGKRVAGFNLQEIIKSGELASLAYVDVTNPAADKESFEYIEALQAAGNRVQFFGTENENSGLIITHTDGSVDVVYKGTSSLRNLATDAWANFAIDDKTGLRCHNGIMKGFYRTQEQVFAILEQIATQQGMDLREFLHKKMKAKGHSLDGGLAEYLIAYIYKTYGVAIKAITFAAPRVFDIADAKRLDKVFHDIYLALQQDTDPVHRVGPGIMGYKRFGTVINLPYSKLHFQHTMSGYNFALRAMDQHDGQLKVGDTVYKFEESNRKGIGNSKWIGNTSIPNPYYPIHQARMWMAEHVDPVVHRAAKTVKDATINVVSKAADVVGSAATTVANTVASAAKKAWNFLWN